MITDPTKLEFYPAFEGKLATVTKEIHASDKHNAKVIILPQDSVILLLKVSPINGCHYLLDNKVSFKRKLQWVTFEADFVFEALFGERHVRFVEKKLSVVPKTAY